MNYIEKYKNSQTGAVSIITAVFVSIILLALVLGFLRVMLSEQRQSTDDDISSRAFYAAESGIEDAKVALSEYVAQGGASSGFDTSTFPVCDTYGESELIDDPQLVTEITCQTIETDLGSVEVERFQPWRSIAIPLQSEDNFNSVVLDWHRPEFDGTGYILRTNNSLPQTNAWSNTPAGMKASVMSRPTSGNPQLESLIDGTRIWHMLPRTSGGNVFDITPGNTTATSGRGGGNAPHAVGCSNAGSTADDGYACSARFNGFVNNRDYYLVLTPLYEATSFRVRLFDGADAVGIVDVQAEVDVTARAGDVFRRVRARVSLIDPSASLIPDLAVGANEVCKDLSFRDEASEFNQVNNPGTNFCNAFEF